MCILLHRRSGLTELGCSILVLRNLLEHAPHVVRGRNFLCSQYEVNPFLASVSLVHLITPLNYPSLTPWSVLEAHIKSTKHTPLRYKT